MTPGREPTIGSSSRPSRARSAVIIADLGFGDSGKGTVTDALVRYLEAGLVVRYNGGAQAGHTVVTDDGRTHTFAQFGAGSFVEGVRTHLSRFMVIHPTGLMVEAEALERLGVARPLERLSVSPQARIITPFHQAANRLREQARGDARHGSCGIGVGETVGDALEHPEEAIVAAELSDASALRRKLQRVQARKWEELRGVGRGPEWDILESPDVAERWIETVGALGLRLDDDPLPDRGTVIFEGAQGVLLDEWRGFHPYTTWSTCTFDNAHELLHDWETIRLGVVRAYATRHGAGPFPTEDASLQLDEPHNQTGLWQGAFRVGWPDAVLARYAVAACGGIDALAVTHLDRVRPGWKMATSYEDGDLALGAFQDLSHQERLTAGLANARPRLTVESDVVAAYERELGVKVWLRSFGPTAADKRWSSSSAMKPWR